MLGGLMMRGVSWLLLLWLALTGTIRADDQPVGEGEPFAHYFSPREYRGGTYCQCAAQDAHGVLYVGDFWSVLEYDGTVWRKIAIDSNYVAGLAHDPGTDRIYVGGLNNLGYLETPPGGERRFISLLDRLPANERAVGTVRGVYVTAKGVFFVGTHRVMRWRDGRFETWDFPAAARLYSSLVEGEVHVFAPEVGMLRLEGDAPVPASDDGLFHRAVVVSVVAGADGARLVATRDDGLFEWKAGAVRPLACDCGDFLKRAGINAALRLREGSLAVATRTAGLVVLDRAGRFRTRLDDRGGLRGRNIFGLYEDAEGGVWVCMQGGVERVEVDSPLSVLRAGPDDDLASAYYSARWLGAMVLGTDSGVFRVVAADPANGVGAHLERVPGTGHSSVSMCTVENGVLTINDGKIFLMDADLRLVPAAEEIVDPSDLCASSVHPGRVYASDHKGKIHALRLDRASGHWVYDVLVADLGASGGRFTVGESPLGDLWVDTSEHGMLRVEFTRGGKANVTAYLGRPGPLRGERLMQISGGGASPLRVMTLHALLGLDDSGREWRVLKEFGEAFCNGTYQFTQGIAYDEDSYWLNARDARDPQGEPLRGRAFAAKPGHAAVFQALPREIEEVIGEPTVYHPGDVAPAPLTTMLLVGTTGNGVARLDVRRWEAALSSPHPFATLIRRAVAEDGDATSGPILEEPLPYTRNSAHFEFAAATLALGAAPRFQTRLVNFGQGQWSNWSERNRADYLNLPEGRYTFEVRSRNADGQTGSVASVPFRVLPPWQRSPWAYALYALAAVAALGAFVRWRGWRLRQRNAALESLVDTRTRELRGARDDAESANRAKSAFLANMSHELRTPLNAVLGYTQLMLKEDELSARGRERVTVIGQSGGHLLDLINEVLDLSKIEAGKFTLSQFDFSLPQLLDETVATFRPRLSEKGLSFTEVRAPDLPTLVHSDPARLRQVLFNLLSNAVKFTHRGGVTLTVRPTDAGRVRFEVADTGVGIASEDQRDIFLAFHQVGERRLAAQGTGLGLAISQRLTGLLGGRIETESAPDRGSRFWFELPLVAVEHSGEPATDALYDPALGKVTGYEGAKRRLLLVDDLGENRRVLRDFLQPLGFEIEEAADGKACLAACARQKPDAVLLDLRLGAAMDGYEVARTLRALMDRESLGIIAITASVFEADRQQAIDAGCDDFLPKPFEEAQLLGTLGRVLGLRWTQEAPAPAGPAAEVGGVLPLAEIVLLRELALRGDVAGILRHLSAWRAAGASSDGAGEVLRRLETLAAAYDMEGIHDLLLTLPPHDRD